ncbi:MAG: PD-(D/E)XK nuclease family protein [bacterium]|nr:PD-(D/E)XK nuclease family protein [bacterium]
MAIDKYNAIWVSHSSMGDYLKCPRSYFLKNVYKDPQTKKKIAIANPALSLGQVVHRVVENLKNFRAEDRFSRDLVKDFEVAWQAVSGEKGGFMSAKEEKEARSRGRSMIERVIKHPGPLDQKTVKIKDGQNGMPPNFVLSEEDQIILCGRIDWLQYVAENDSVRILDFKTGKSDEREDSLQLPIYLLLVNALQKRTVSGASYWYLDREDRPKDVVLPKAEESREKVLKTAKEVKKAREIGIFECPKGKGGCFNCEPYEKILRGDAKFLGQGEYGQMIFLVN